LATSHPTASVAPSAVITGDVTVGPGCRILPGAVLNGDHGRIVLGEHTLVMEHAVLRGRPGHPLDSGSAVLIGPHAHVNGATVRDEVFIATGASIFAGAVVGAGAELRINSVVHVNTHVAPGTTVPIGWIAAGDPAQLFAPEQHDALWAVQRELDFPGTMYGVPRSTPMREIMRRQSEAHAPRGEGHGPGSAEPSDPAGSPAEGEPPRLPRYRVLTGADDDTFCARVGELLDLGYTLHGSPSGTFDGEAVVVTQALVWDRPDLPPPGREG
jgi:carbonic anhydrase/acetyltransferase-like protein (isoleucine patch superfamily)